jgi:hypothetical protein
MIYNLLHPRTITFYLPRRASYLWRIEEQRLIVIIELYLEDNILLKIICRWTVCADSLHSTLPIVIFYQHPLPFFFSILAVSPLSFYTQFLSHLRRHRGARVALVARHLLKYRGKLLGSVDHDDVLTTYLHQGR